MSEEAASFVLGGDEAALRGVLGEFDDQDGTILGGHVVSAFLLWQVVKTGSNAQKEKEIGFSEFLSDVDQGNIHDVTFIGQEVKGKFKNPDSPFHTIVPANYPDMYKKLTEKNVPYSFKDISNGTWPSWILNLAPLVLLGALWFFMIRQMQTGGNKALSFGKSRARLLSM